MAEDVHGIAMETVTGNLPQVRCQVKVVVRGNSADMSHVSRQMREFGLDLSALLIPTLQCCNRETMTKRVNPGRSTFRVNDAGGQT